MIISYLPFFFVSRCISISYKHFFRVLNITTIMADSIPFEATPPGELIKDELDIRDDMTQKDLAKEMGITLSILDELIKGKRPLTADCAIDLEKILDIPADYWIQFQSQYEKDKERIKQKNIKKTKVLVP